MKELLRWRYLPMHGLALLFWVAIFASSCATGQSSGQSSGQESDNRPTTLVKDFGFGYTIEKLCDGGNLIYASRVYGGYSVAVIPGGCK